MVEIWKPIINFEDYQISNYGRVKSLKFNVAKSTIWSIAHGVSYAKQK